MRMLASTATGLLHCLLLFAFLACWYNNRQHVVVESFSPINVSLPNHLPSRNHHALVNKLDNQRESVLSRGLCRHQHPHEHKIPYQSRLFCVDSTIERSFKEAKRIRGPIPSPQITVTYLYSSHVGGVPRTTSRRSIRTRTQAALRIKRALLVCYLALLLPLILPQVCQAVKLMQTSILWYSDLLDRHPIVTKSVTAGVIGLLGDFLAQALERQRHLHNNKSKSIAVVTDNTTTGTTNHIPTTPISLIFAKLKRWLTLDGTYNYRRGLSILADGLLLSGPLMHYGYEFFEHVFPISQGGIMGALAAVAHVVTDMVLLDSLFVAILFWVTGLFEGYSLRQILQQFQADYIPTMKASGLTSLIVLPLQVVCFRFLPLSFRVLAVNFVDIIWDGVISYMSHKSRGGGGHGQHSHPPETASSANSSVEVVTSAPALLMVREPVAFTAVTSIPMTLTGNNNVTESSLPIVVLPPFSSLLYDPMIPGEVNLAPSLGKIPQTN